MANATAAADKMEIQDQLDKQEMEADELEKGFGEAKNKQA